MSNNQTKENAKPIETSQAVLKVSANPAFLEWPTDPWGFTREIRAAVLSAASRMTTSADKKAILDETLAIAVAYVNARFEANMKDAEDAATRDQE